MLISVRNLKAVDLFASKEEVRYYLNGVFFEFEGGVLNLVATDGHRLLTTTEKRKEWKNKKEKDLKFIIPSSLIKKIKPVLGCDDLEIIIDGVNITIIYNGDTFQGEAIDGTFPDYRRVLPDQEKKAKEKSALRKKMTKAEIDNECVDIFQIGFNPKYLADFAKVNELLGFKGSGVRLSATTPQEPTVVTMGGSDAYMGVLMPMRV